MAQFNSAERVEEIDRYNQYSVHGEKEETVRINDLMIEPTDVMTGGETKAASCIISSR